MAEKQKPKSKKAKLTEAEKVALREKRALEEQRQKRKLSGSRSSPKRTTLKLIS